MIAAIETIEICTLSHHTEDTCYLYNVNTGYTGTCLMLEKNTKPTTHHVISPYSPALYSTVCLYSQLGWLVTNHVDHNMLSPLSCFLFKC